VVAPHGGLEQFIYVGMTSHDVDAIGHLPEGQGLLGALIDDPRPIRLQHLSEDPRSCGLPPGHPPMDGFLGVPVRVRDEVFGNLYLANQSGGEFTADDEELVLSLASTAGFAIENARLYAETTRRQAWAVASGEITAALLSVEASDPLGVLASRVLSLADAHLVYVVRPADDPAMLVVETASGEGEDDVRGRQFPIAGSIAGSVIEGGQPRIISEASSREPFAAAEWSFGPTMAVPLISAGRARGVLVVSRRQGSLKFVDADLEIAADFAGRAAVAMELADARADQQRMLLLEERGRIARDLHDHVIQQLYGTGLELQAVAGLVPRGRAADTVEGAIENIDAAIAQIRTAIFALTRSRSGGSEAIRHRIIDVVNEIGTSLPGTPRLTFSGPVDLVIDGALAHDVLAVLREALTNVVKHAEAQHVTVSVATSGREVVLEVTDDGIGIPPTGRRSGLRNLETRALERGGSFSAGSEDGRTVLLWSVPLTDEAKVTK
jgi:signal transduction histidine kinase